MTLVLHILWGSSMHARCCSSLISGSHGGQSMGSRAWRSVGAMHPTTVCSMCLTTLGDVVHVAVERDQQSVTPRPAAAYVERWRLIRSPSTLPVYKEQVDGDALFCDGRPPASIPALPPQAIRPGASALNARHTRQEHCRPHALCAYTCSMMPLVSTALGMHPATGPPPSPPPPTPPHTPHPMHTHAHTIPATATTHR